MRKREVRSPLSDPRTAERWLASLPRNDPLLVAHELRTVLGPLAQRGARRNPSGLAAVFAVDAQTSALVGTLVTQYADHAERSSKIESQLWHELFELTKSYLACYAAFAREISDDGHHARTQFLLPELIARQVRHMGADAKIRLYRCEQWIPARWAELHAVFTRACALKAERQSVVLEPGGAPTTVEREYLTTLVLQQAAPGNLTASEVQWVAERLAEWSPALRLTLVPQAAASFYVDLAGSAGLKRRSVTALEGRVLFLDTRPMLASLMQEHTALDQALKSATRPDPADGGRRRLELMVRLASRLDPEFRPLPRRGERIASGGIVDAVVGFANIAGLLSDDTAHPPTESGGERSFAKTMDLAVFGHARTEVEQRPGDFRRRRTGFLAPGGPWEMKDMSVSGFRLHAPMGVAADLTLNMLVAINRRGETTWLLGIVRRMRRLSADVAEIGLQLIANAVTGVDVVEQRKAREDDYSVDGEPGSPAGRRFRCLLLSYNRRAGEGAAQSLIIPPPEYQPARRHAMHIGRTVHPVRFGRQLEHHADWLWTVIEPVEPHEPPAPPTVQVPAG